MDIYSIKIRSIDGSPLLLEQWRGKVLLIVNVASNCGFTKQYAPLEEIYREFKDQGFVVLGCPCNQFGGQEPGGAKEIKDFCTQNYGVSFPLTEKINVNGNSAHQLFQFLKEQAPGVLGTEAIKWNFTKFLVARDGTVRARYSPNLAPTAFVDEILELL